jgi:hypothetical protein
VPLHELRDLAPDAPDERVKEKAMSFAFVSPEIAEAFDAFLTEIEARDPRESLTPLGIMLFVRGRSSAVATPGNYFVARDGKIYVQYGGLRQRFEYVDHVAGFRLHD